VTPLLDAVVRRQRPQFDLEVELSVGAGETVAVLGPNGAGKSTLLRVLAGLEPLTEGRIELDGEVLAAAGSNPGGGPRPKSIDVAVEERSVGLVFQDRALFAHLSALDNVAFGLRSGRRPRLGRSPARARASAWLDRLGLSDRAGAKPSELSGGQAQRVALARSLAVEPKLLLLDEPLAALDASTRVAVRRDLGRHLSTHDGARVLVTHDPLDAYALADRLVVLEAGRVTQSGPPADIVARPGSTYVADLVGVNLWWGDAGAGLVAVTGGGRLVAAAAPAHGRVGVTVHPRVVALHRFRPEGSPRNVWPGTVTAVELLGDRVRVQVSGTPPVVAEVTVTARAALGLEPGADVWASVKASELNLFPV